MRKKLRPVGNSLALIIDKPLRRLMQLNPSLEVEVQFDGTRLLVEAVPYEPDANEHAQPNKCRSADKRPLSLAMVLEAKAVARAMVEQYDVPQRHLEALYPGETRVMRFVGWAASLGNVVPADLFQRSVIRRMHLCFERLRAGFTWDEAMAAALRAEPLPPGTGNNVGITPL